MPDMETRRGTHYEVEGRYDYHAVDRYRDDVCIGTVQIQMTERDADSLAYYLNEAVWHGRNDLLSGFDLEELGCVLLNCAERLDDEANEARGNQPVPGGTDWEAFATQLEHEAGILHTLARRIAQ